MFQIAYKLKPRGTISKYFDEIERIPCCDHQIFVHIDTDTFWEVHFVGDYGWLPISTATVWCEHLHTIVPFICHKQVKFSVETKPPGLIELSRSGSRLPDFIHEIPIALEDVNAVGVSVSDVDMAHVVKGDVNRIE